MLERATAALPDRRGWGQTQLSVVVAGGPRQQVIRPAELDADRLGSNIQREAFFGEHAVLDRTAATEVRVRDSQLIIEQQNAVIGVDELGTIRISVPATRASRSTSELAAIIEEDLHETIFRALRFAGWLFGEVDPVGRVSDVVPLVALTGGGYLPWRLRAEHAANPQSGTMGKGGEDIRVTLTPLRRHRAALTHDTERIAEDVTVLLRREVRP